MSAELAAQGSMVGGGGGGGRSVLAPALRSALSAAAGARMSNGLCWRHSRGDAARDSRRTKVKRSLLLQVVQTQMPVTLTTPESVGLFFP